MQNLNLVLTFKLAGDSRYHVKGAVGLKLDGQGGLSFRDAETGVLERIPLQELKTFRIQPIAHPLIPLPLAG